MENASNNKARDLREIEWLFQKVEIARAAWKLILIGFVTLSVLGSAALVAFVRPIYSSHMVLPLPPTVLPLIHTDAILVPAARNFYPDDANLSAEVQRLRSRLVASDLRKGSELFSVSVTDHSPEHAQAILNQILSQIIAASKPVGSNLAGIQKQIDSEKRAMAQLKELAAALKDRLSRPNAAVEGDAAARAFTILVSDIAGKEQKLSGIEDRLEGIKIEDVVVRPTLGSLVEQTDFYRKLGLILLASFLLPVSLVFLRDLWRRRNDRNNERPVPQHTK